MKNKEEISVSVEHKIRVEKVEKMRALGIEPWPEFMEVSATAHDIIDEFQDDKECEYTVAGRVVTMRMHGKTAFVTIQDHTGRVQIYIRQDIVGDDTFEHIKHNIDIGDIVWCSGYSFRTKMGEITIRVQNLVLLSKCLHPLPEKFHGLADIETIYRQRYLDLITNAESRERFVRRSKIVQTIRSFLDNHGYIEVETPMLHPIPGGAVAKPFVTHHNALDSEFYLRIAPELYLKRLVIGGFERVYEINRNFRNEGISTRHNPEFTMLEFYTAHKDYIWVMDLVEKMIRQVAMELGNSLQLPFGDMVLDFDKPFKRISVYNSVLELTECSIDDLSEITIDATLKKYNVSVANKNASQGEKIFALFEELVEPQLMQPTFITHFPIEVSPLSKRDQQDQTVAARFELFAGGMELSNGFNELNDPFDQAERFKWQAQARAGGDQEAHYFDADYILALEYALPPTAGVGIGIDRLTMLLTNTTSIKDVILFPTLKKKSENF
ncbi:lysine--tRNA ligase [Candidatus Dependentiae bacterium]|nr:lysine--tRNA ligase [Candidatus Dependentiae bacterium]